MGPTLIRAANLTGIEELMTQLGGDPAALLARYHIDPAHIRNPDAYVPYRSLAGVLERAAAECACPDLGLRLVQWQGLNMLGPIAVMARNAHDVADAFAGLSRYLHVHGPALKLSLTGHNHAGQYCFDYRIDEPGLHQMPQAYELSLANGVHILRLLAGDAARPARMYFKHARLSPPAAYARVFGCPIEFEAEHCGFDLHAADMKRPLLGADNGTLQLAQRFLESSQPPGGQISDRVSELIHRLLATGQCSIGAVAEQLAMHPRTLQRALQDCSTSYDALLDDIRQNKAREYLAQTAMRFSQVAGLLGYTDQSTFNRACRRWYGCTPKALRQSLR
ncbi:MAG: AraC family transcriptional regulator [Burkholderiaceae bacterium]